MTAQCDLVVVVAVVVVVVEEEGLGWWREKRLGRVVVVERSWSFIVGSIILLLLLGFEATRVRAFDRRIKVRGGVQERESCENGCFNGCDWKGDVAGGGCRRRSELDRRRRGGDYEKGMGWVGPLSLCLCP